MALFFRSKSDRNENRVQVVPSEIRGLLSASKGNLQQPFLIWDVSPQGIGIWISEGLPQGEEVVLTIGQPYLIVVKAEVMWCEMQAGQQGFRCGLRATDKGKVFDTLHSAFLNRNNT